LGTAASPLSEPCRLQRRQIEFDLMMRGNKSPMLHQQRLPRVFTIYFTLP